MVLKSVPQLYRVLPFSGNICAFCLESPLIARSCRRSLATPRRSPTVRRNEAASKQQPGANASLPSQSREALPPVVLLKSARQSGVFPLESGRALELLVQFQGLISTQDNSRLQQLLRDYDVQAADLTILAKILLRCSRSEQRALARQLLLRASALSDASATLQLVSEGLRVSRLSMPELRQPLRHLDNLARREKNPQAAYLLGSIWEKERKKPEALHLYESVLSNEDTASTNDDKSRASILVALGLLRLNKGDTAGAEEAFQKGAELDNPDAHYHLAKSKPQTSSERQVHLLVAASAGNIEAAHDLGTTYLLKTEGKDLQGQMQIEARAMAYEWFSLAADADHAPSQLALASLLRDDGKLEEGMRWLDRASKLEDHREQALHMKSAWQDNAISNSINAKI
ncbi:MAG: hypothetical protein M1833_004282 [Piccolia ochrophora]|nr:MAG: hypothetical protein M1833_004282 [Piccolia ochrophora]